MNGYEFMTLFSLLTHFIARAMRKTAEKRLESRLCIDFGQPLWQRITERCVYETDKYKVFVWDNDGVISEFGLIKLLENGNIEIELPTNKTLNPENKIYVKVINADNETAIKGITVNVTDAAKNTASDITNINGIAVVPVSDTDITDRNGYAQVIEDEKTYNIVVEDTKTKIENAVVKIKGGKISIIPVSYTHLS